MGGLFVLFSLSSDRLALAQGQGNTTCPEAQIVFLIDQSGSMSGQGGTTTVNDPYNLRFQGVQVALDVLTHDSLAWPSGEGVEVSVINFGSRVEPVPQFLGRMIAAQNDAEVRTLESEIATVLDPKRNPDLPTFLGNTNFVAAFQAAVDQLSPRPGCPPPQRQAIVFLTDGMPWLDEDEAPQYWVKGNFSTDAHMKALRDYVKQFYQGDIYVIALDNAHRFWGRMQPYWMGIVKDPNHLGAVDSAREMAIRIYDIVNEIVQNIPTRAGVITQKACGPVQVPPFTRLITFRFFKQTSGEHLTVQDPQGNVVARDGQGIGGNARVSGANSYIETVRISQPQPGQWVATPPTQSAGSYCSVYLEQITWDLKLRTREGVAFTQTPFRLVLATSSGAPQGAGTGDMPDVTAWLISPSGQRIDLSLQATKNFIYQSTFIPEEPGTYIVQAFMSYQGKNIAGSPTKPLSVDSIEIHLPKIVWYHALTSGMQYPQFQALPLEFDLLDPQGKHVDLVYPLQAEVKVSHAQKEETLSFTPDQSSQHWKTEYRPTEEGDYEFAYRIAVAPPGAAPKVLEEGHWNVEVYPVLPIRAQFKEKGHLPVTDWLRRPKDAVLHVSLVSPDGTPVDVASLTGESVPFDVHLFTAAGPQKVQAQVRAIDKGQYEIRLPHLQPGGYTLRLVPHASLPHGYIWQDAPWDTRFVATVSWGFYALVGGIALAMLAALLCIFAWGMHRRQPLARVRVYEVDEEGGELPVATWTVRGKQVYRRGRGLVWYLPCPFPVPAASLSGVRGVRRVALTTHSSRGRGQRAGVVRLKVWLPEERRPLDVKLHPGASYTMVASGTKYRLVREDTSVYGL